MRAHRIAVAAALLAAPGAWTQGARSDPAAATLVGEWELNLARTHYGPGVDRRRRERFACGAEGPRVTCHIRGERADGRVVVGRFAAVVDGAASAVMGVPGVDAVRLHAAGPSIADATFLLGARPVFGYRAYRSDDGRTLTIVPVDPVSRVALTTLVVYDRR